MSSSVLLLIQQLVSCEVCSPVREMGAHLSKANIKMALQYYSTNLEGGGYGVHVAQSH